MSNITEIQNKFLQGVLNRSSLPEQKYFDEDDDCFKPSIEFNNGYKNKVASFKLGDTTCDVAEKIMLNRIRIGVVADNKKVVGTIGRTDLIRGIFKVLKETLCGNLCENGCDCADIEAVELMQKRFVSVRGSESIYHAVEKMNGRNRGHINMERIIMLNEKGQLIGLLERKELAAKLQEMWTTKTNGGVTMSEDFALLIYKSWVDNHPFPDKPSVKDRDNKYSPRTILKEMEKKTALGMKFRRSYREVYNEVLKGKSEKGEGIAKIVEALVQPPTSEGKMREAYNIFLRKNHQDRKV